MEIPVLIKITASLAVIIVINRYTGFLLIATIFGAATLSVWTDLGWNGLLETTTTSATSSSTIGLLIVTLQVIWLSLQMAKTGVMNELVSSLRATVSKRNALIMLPAMIGMLPMPGGAVFSAPLVEECDHENHLTPMRKTLVNYWFRHLWEYWWPLYPGVVLAVEKTGLDIWQLMLLMLPMSLISMLIGYTFFLSIKNLKGVLRNEDQPWHHGAKRVLQLLTPIFSVVLVYAYIRFAAPQLSETNKYIPLIVGILSGAILLQRIKPLNKQDWKEILTKPKTYNLALVVFAIITYGALIETEFANGETIVTQMRIELENWNISPLVVIMLLPFITGVSTGLTVGFVGTSFPVVINLLGPTPPLATLLPTVFLAYGFGYAGLLLSPVHVCLLVTNKHFKTHVGGAIQQLMAPVTVMLTIVLIGYAFLNWLF